MIIALGIRIGSVMTLVSLIGELERLQSWCFDMFTEIPNLVS